jgi:hypothetical protein
VYDQDCHVFDTFRRRFAGYHDDSYFRFMGHGGSIIWAGVLWGVFPACISGVLSQSMYVRLGFLDGQDRLC